ncbi:sulfotransferase family protein [Falsiroseomonas sp.]|uniref:sulfotransferase family protein n=1 Tax=Falsiroseomonas sp. TaxID=2870721 RepID=UPI00271D4520|nr:hypothetical protein [Falsiroseomonas sp.]MDO9500390.1 hypothetical protein [Falsiroseomonas sp.]
MSAEAPSRPAVLVLGMHRSGTSAFTRVLALHGLALPSKLLVAQPSNPRGYWESRAVTLLDDRILKAAGRSWSDPRPPVAGQLTQDQHQRFAAQALNILREELPGEAPFVLKDPRICRLMWFWEPVLREFGVSPRVVMPVRNPLEVARSLAEREGLETAESLRLWLGHVLAAERDTRHLRRAVVHYDELLADWRGLLAQLGMPVREETELETVAFLSARLRHHDISTDDLLRDPAVPAPIKRVYAELRGASAETSLDPAPFEVAVAWLDSTVGAEP